jgi:alkyl sulfatase BDS1-like metallo-beta-lactamase superfamily hydrolase
MRVASGLERARASVAGCALLLAACGAREPTPAAPVEAGEASPAVIALHAEVAAGADLSDPLAFEDAAQGLVARPAGTVLGEDGRVVWDFDAFAFVDGEAPATVNPSLWRQARLNGHAGLFKVADRIWQLRGFDLANLTLVEGDTGWIVVDTLTARETAAAAMAFAREHLGDRKVSAIIYTHSHVDHFGGALGVVSAEEARERGIPIVAPAGFMAEATSENLMMGGAMPRRSMYMYGDRLPRDARGLVDNGLGKAVAYGRIGLIAPTRVVDAPSEELVLDGVRFVFHNVPGSEAPSEFVFALPDLRAFCGAELMSHTLHNLYTLRGAKVRDALKWAADLDASLAWSEGAEVLFNQHHWPVRGATRIREFIARQRDAYRYIHDQTVRRMNAGETAPEIAETLRLPKVLHDELAVRGYYGTVRHNVYAVYQFYLGWYDANPANLSPLPPVDAARRYVDLAGGRDALLAKARAALAAGEHRWSAELLHHAVYADAGDYEARELLARAFEQLGFAAESAAWRNVYLSGAFEARNGPPESGVTLERLQDMLVHVPIDRFLDRLAASIDGPAAEDLRITVNLVFSDLGETRVLRLENGVLHHAHGPAATDADATLTLTHGFFVRMMSGQAKAADLLLSDETGIDGSALALGRLFGLVERAEGTFPVVTRD